MQKNFLAFIKGHHLINIILDYSGINFIITKCRYRNSDESTPPTITLWIVSIYFAFYGYTSQRYENRLDYLETKVNTIITQASLNPLNVKEALERVPNTQKITLPYKPEFINPLSTISSWFIYYNDTNTTNVLKGFIKSYVKESSIIQGINLSNADLSRIDLQGARFLNADLSYVDFHSSNLTESDFSNSTLHYADFTNSILDKANFNNATNLNTARGLPEWVEKGLLFGVYSQGELINNIRKGYKSFKNANLINSDLTKIDFSSLDVHKAYFRGSDFSEAKLYNTKFSIYIETGAGTGHYEKTDLNNCNFHNANLSNADITQVSLLNAKLINADLTSVSASDAFLVNCNLSNAILINANLQRSQLKCANLENANLSGADLRGVNFSKAKIENAIFKNAIYSDSTKFPNGFSPEINMMIKKDDDWGRNYIYNWDQYYRFDYCNEADHK